MVYVTRRMRFSASHRLHNPTFSEEKNIEVFDKCNNPNGHGHNYVLEVTVAGDPDPDTGYVIDLKKLKKILNEVVISEVDHKHLNLDVEAFRGIIPSAENIAVVIWRLIEDKLTSGKLYRVRLYETENNFVEYFGEEVDLKKFV